MNQGAVVAVDLGRDGLTAEAFDVAMGALAAKHPFSLKPA